MGWLDSFWSQNNDQQDQYAKFDPKLRAFLERESSTKTTDSPKPPTQKPTRPPPAELQPTADNASTAPRVPKESLYQDGRYAHLWKTYSSRAQIEGEQKTEDEKVAEVLEAYRERKSTINHDAMENCAMEQSEYRACMTSGSWRAKMTMCSTELRAFERCYTTQARLLKALGYLSQPGRPLEVDEQIRTHADALWLRILEQEAAVEKAKAEGKPAPVFPPVISPKSVGAQLEQGKTTTSGPGADVTGVNAAMGDKKWQAELAKLADADKPLEVAAMLAEARLAAQTKETVLALRNPAKQARKDRVAKGEGSLVDRAMSLLSGSDV